MAVRILVPTAALATDPIQLDGDAYHYATRVRRLPLGAEVELFDGQGLAVLGTLVEIDSTRARVATLERRPEPAPILRITALVPLIKGDRMDTCVEKLTEVGVDDLVVWQAARAVVRLDVERATERRRRLAAVATAAARQSGRATTPVLDGPVPLREALARGGAGATRWILHPGGSAIEPGALRTGAGAELVLLSGPEGGLADDELAAADAAGFARVGLGRRILRAETAPVVATALVRALTES